MRVICLGSGAYAGLLGGFAAINGAEVTLVARADLATLREQGLTLIDLQGQQHKIPVRAVASSEVHTLEPPDVLVIGWKAHDMLSTAFAELVRPLFGAHTLAIFPQNGVAWFFPPLFKLTIPHFPADPQGDLARLFPLSQTVGAVSYPAVTRIAPATVRMQRGNLLPMGLCAPSPWQETLSSFAALLQAAGLKVPILEPGIPMASEWWIKVTGFGANALSALTGLTMSAVAQHPVTGPLLRCSMEEAYAVGERLGLTLRVPLERRLRALHNMGGHKPSTLIDIENNTPPELYPTLGALIAVAKALGVPCPVNQRLFQLLAVADAYLRGQKFLPPEVLVQ